jgi:hypothetical protein
MPLPNCRGRQKAAYFAPMGRGRVPSSHSPSRARVDVDSVRNCQKSRVSESGEKSAHTKFAQPARTHTFVLHKLGYRRAARAGLGRDQWTQLGSIFHVRLHKFVPLGF